MSTWKDKFESQIRQLAIVVACTVEGVRLNSDLQAIRLTSWTEDDKSSIKSNGYSTRLVNNPNPVVVIGKRKEG